MNPIYHIDIKYSDGFHNSGSYFSKSELLFALRAFTEK